jgi:serine/threonine-protein kinase
MDRHVALKVLKPSVGDSAPTARDRFHREVRIISKLRHPNTVTIHDFGETVDEIVYMVLEYVEGETLKSVLRDEGAMQPERAVHIATQIAKSLAEAHRHGVVHRDLKPANIMLTDIGGEADFVKVLDFGVARLLSGEVSDLTSAGLPEGERELIGTPRYMSPEQVRGEHLTGASDVYGLGLIFYEMLTGTQAVLGDTTMALITQQISPEPLRLPLLEGVRPALRGVIQCATSKRPTERYDSTESFLEDLQEATIQMRREDLGMEQASSEFLASNSSSSGELLMSDYQHQLDEIKRRTGAHQAVGSSQAGGGPGASGQQVFSSGGGSSSQGNPQGGGPHQGAGGPRQGNQGDSHLDSGPQPPSGTPSSSVGPHTPGPGSAPRRGASHQAQQRSGSGPQHSFSQQQQRSSVGASGPFQASGGAGTPNNQGRQGEASGPGASDSFASQGNGSGPSPFDSGPSTSGPRQGGGQMQQGGGQMPGSSGQWSQAPQTRAASPFGGSSDAPPPGIDSNRVTDPPVAGLPDDLPPPPGDDNAFADEPQRPSDVSQERAVDAQERQEDDVVDTTIHTLLALILGFLAGLGSYVAFLLMGAILYEFIDGQLRMIISLIVAVALPVFPFISEGARRERFHVEQPALYRLRRMLLGAALATWGAAVIMSFAFPERIVHQLRANPNWFMEDGYRSEGFPEKNRRFSKATATKVEQFTDAIGMYDPTKYGSEEEDDKPASPPPPPEKPEPTRPGTRGRVGPGPPPSTRPSTQSDDETDGEDDSGSKSRRDRTGRSETPDSSSEPASDDSASGGKDEDYVRW